MQKDNQNIPQEFQHKGKENPSSKDVEVNLENNDIQTDSVMITGSGDPNLSPDAGKPMI
ncbi:MAG TPA: hypothetical protein VEV44_01990 [Pseudoneobacillus sp.]|nr:hypothetical protein [Pseudoneobacillus sp.]